MAVRSRPQTALVVAFAILAVVLPLAASCGDDDDGEDTGADVDADVVLARAADEFGAIESFHFTLDHENGTTPIVFDLGLDRAEGDLVAPGRMHAEIEAEQGPIRVEVEIIAIEDDLWLTDPFGSGVWQKIEEGIDVRDIFAPDIGLPELLRNAFEPRVTGRERVDGVQTYRIEARVDAGALAAIAPVAEPGVDVPVTVWIGEDDSLIRRARLDGPITTDEDNDIRRQIDLTGFDEPVTIEPPAVG